MVFRSKVDEWLIWLVRLSMLSTLAVVAAVTLSHGDTGAAITAGAIVLVVHAFVEWIFRTTYYTVDQDYLRIRSGPFRWRVPVNEIESIAPSDSLLSSPALSIDRLEIRYGGGRRILVSPEDREWFVNTLRSVNSRIDLPTAP